MKKLQRHLLYLGVGEFAALCTFGLLYRSLRLGAASLAGFLYLMFVLFQGSAYWAYRYVLILKRKPPSGKAVKFWRVSRYLSTGLMGLTGFVILIVHAGSWDLFCGIAAFVFAIIEYVNYFWYRLSYGKSGFNLRVLVNTRLQKSSISKLIGRKVADQK